MRKSGGSVRAATGATALALLLASAPAAAQSTPDFRIPTTRPTSNPRSQGPVDADHPVVRPSPTPSPAPVPTPVPAPSPAPSAAPLPRPSQSTAAAPRPAANVTPQPRPIAAAPTATTSAAPASDSALPAAPSDLPASPAPGITATDSFDLPAMSDSTDTASVWYLPWLAAAAALMAAAGALAWWRRRRSAAPLMLEFEPPVVPVAGPAPAAPPLAAPRPAPAAPLPEPKLSLNPQGLGIALEARRMSASLIATTLSYTLTLTNHSAQPLSALAVEGDMISAHASIPPDQQIASNGLRLELRHALVTLAPGESAQFTGDFRLPLTAVTPIRSGEAAFFVPLARLRVEASTPAGASLVQVQTFVVGELPDAAGAGLRPFRLDLGPRVYSRIGQRAVS